MAETLVKKPRLIDFFEDGDFSKDIDILSFVKAKREFDQQLHSSTIVADNLEKKHPFRNRKVYPKRDPTTSTWWRDYVVAENGNFGDPNHRDGKLFELRFFLPLVNIRELVDTVNKPEHYFWRANEDAFGRPAHPLALLVLGSLRILTRNCTFDDLYEQTFISAETHRTFFHKFIPWYATSVFPTVVKMPTTQHLAAESKEYELAGLPGAFASVDCVHVRIWGVASNLKQLSTGKEHFPSRAFEVACNHRGIIISSTRGFYGSVSDKSIVKFDGAVMAVRSGLYDENRYNIYTEDGSRLSMKGAYYLCDNGYHKWVTMMEPSKIAKMTSSGLLRREKSLNITDRHRKCIF